LARKYTLWATVSGLEAVSRVGLQVVVTAVLARLLRPEDFGVAALILALVTVFSMFVATPFEDALAQRKILRTAHVGVALAVSWLAATGFLVLSVALGKGLAWAYGQSQMALLLPATALSLFPTAPLVVGTALARRHRRFNAIALSSLIANVAASAATLAAAALGAGVWALILFRIVVVCVQAVALLAMVDAPLRPRWSRRHFGDLSRFAWFTLWSRLTDNLTYLAFNTVISLFGLSELGKFNMAMRVIEPVRGAAMAIAHNLNFSHFQPAAQDTSALGARVREACARLSLLCGPAFFGIAAVAPLLIPTLAGPGWEESIDITRILALGSGCMLSFYSPVYTGLAASGRPQYGLYANLFRLLAISAGAAVCAGFGAVGIGLARVTGDASDVALALLFARRRMQLSVGSVLSAAAAPLIFSAAMALCVAWAGPHLLAWLRPAAALAVSIGLGAALYGGLVALFARGAARALLRPGGLRAA